ncbi:hypothetical protein ACVWYN_002803 [Pedobacter sp. UYP24]
MKKIIFGLTLSLAGVLMTYFNMPEADPQTGEYIEEITFLRLLYCYVITVGIIIATAGLGDFYQSKKKLKHFSR